ncbi:PBPb domain-containing protein [Hyphomicrobiales bacterium]|nr:conserved exported hypothetical protein [Hyphomicrobiales bacterium]CAH1666808.1 PBPb domain-containing protein [Hyphomicrobiales bacterium]
MSGLVLNRRGMLALSASAAFAGTLGGTGRVFAQAPSAWDQAIETGIVRFGMYPNQAPYNFTLDGKPRGFRRLMAEDFTARLSEKVGKQLKVEEVPSSLQNIVLDIQANRIDVHMGLTVTEERKKAIDMFGPIYMMPVAAFNSASFNPGTNWDDYDKKGIRISVIQGSTDEAAARDRLTKVTFRGFKSAGEVVLDVISGNADAAVMGLLLGMNGAKRNPNIGSIIPLQPLYAPASGGGCRKDGDGRFTKFLQEWAVDLQTSGRAAKLILVSMDEAGLDVNKLPPGATF